MKNKGRYARRLNQTTQAWSPVQGRARRDRGERTARQRRRKPARRCAAREYTLRTVRRGCLPEQVNKRAHWMILHSRYCMFDPPRVGTPPALRGNAPRTTLGIRPSSASDIPHPFTYRRARGGFTETLASRQERARRSGRGARNLSREERCAKGRTLSF